jgi:hypothetical protein
VDNFIITYSEEQDLKKLMADCYKIGKCIVEDEPNKRLSDGEKVAAATIAVALFNYKLNTKSVPKPKEELKM